MTWVATIVNRTIKILLNILCRIDSDQLSRVPDKGPLILVANHINFLEIPIVFIYLDHRPVTGFVKKETWNNPILGYLFNLWQGIPIKRGEPDIKGLRSGIEAVKSGKILAIAPEGTRSGDGCLKRGNPGIVLVALQTGAPILPLVYYGSEMFRYNIRHLKKTEFHIVVGQPFFLDPGNIKVDRNIRELMVNEIMYQLAVLLPDQYRGAYSNLDNATEQFLRFPPQSTSNLLYAKCE